MKENNLVYSTETGRIKSEAPTNAVPSGDGIARIRRETKGRKGKGVTTVSGVLMAETELKMLCAELKKLCGTGGTLKDNVIEIQGDHRDKIKAALEKKGLQVKLAGG
ncbi:stress response translation initiation inhibitor YciH [Aliiglaciecola sp. CAU 1673]|uniref:stress response translation initiation inhibitor YciH n=1 Tax=Aliiglaciecola sp. CAU 1673 TaxID=3032595 RepID=UPI0023DC8BAC|nr:stress response translation initiation inhibitor YciH [Aliiglaciecola sp. CAU 1673]MDF2177161.1 stress response translation initiation inhibitor YciH [Aliiglaciecola sp. CAU 1673]